MAKRKKKAWNNTNPLYRYLHRTKTTRRRAKTKVKRRRTGGLKMARRKKVSHRKSGLGGSSSLIRSALVGIGAAHLSGYVPVTVPYKEEIAGAAGAYMLGGKSMKSAAVGAAAVFLTKMASGQVTQTGGNY